VRDRNGNPFCFLRWKGAGKNKKIAMKSPTRAAAQAAARGTPNKKSVEKIYTF